MSLIMGVHLLDRIYLICDTRLSYGDGTVKDDIIKLFKVNNKISVVAAGTTLPASYILNRLRELTDETTTVHQFREIIAGNLRSLITEYVEKTGHHTGKVAYIVGGYNNGTVKKIEVSKLGNAMSGLPKVLEGMSINQGIDNRLVASLGQLSGKKKGDYIRVNNVVSAELFSYEFNISTAEISEPKDAECYDYLIYHPRQSSVVINLPDDVLSYIEFRERPQGITESVLYEDSEKLMGFVAKVIRENNFSSVGGHTLTFLQNQNGVIFPTGDLATVKDGNLVKLGSIFVENGELCFELEDGTKGKYRYLAEVAKDYINKPEGESMSI